jgi:hypothetical protein
VISRGKLKLFITKSRPSIALAPKPPRRCRAGATPDEGDGGADHRMWDSTWNLTRLQPCSLGRVGVLAQIACGRAAGVR